MTEPLLHSVRRLMVCLLVLLVGGWITAQAPAQQGTADDAQVTAPDESRAVNQSKKAQRQKGQKKRQRQAEKGRGQDASANAPEVGLRVFTLEHVSVPDMMNVIWLRYDPSAYTSATPGYTSAAANSRNSLIVNVQPQESTTPDPAAEQQDDEEVVSGFLEEEDKRQAQQRGKRAGQAESEREQPLRLAADQRTKTLFVRGAAERLGEIEELVDAFDQPRAELQEQQWNGKVLLPLKHVSAGEVTGILQQLHIPCQTLRLGETELLVIASDQETILEQAREVIAKLDQAQNGTAQEASPDASTAEQEQAATEGEADADAE